jgi:hypothetical protein
VPWRVRTSWYGTVLYRQHSLRNRDKAEVASGVIHIPIGSIGSVTPPRARRRWDIGPFPSQFPPDHDEINQCSPNPDQTSRGRSDLCCLCCGTRAIDPARAMLLVTRSVTVRRRVRLSSVTDVVVYPRQSSRLSSVLQQIAVCPLTNSRLRRMRLRDHLGFPS